MKLDGIYIDRFGLLQEVAVEGMPDGLSMFLGDNETGKTTLLAFIRCMLFGFPDGRSRENRYLPPDGSGRRGRLRLRTASGECRVLERTEGGGGGSLSVTLPDGAAGHEDALFRLIGGAGRELYCNVFAFSLHELQRLETLDDTEIKSAIYGAGAGLGAVSLPKFKSALNAEMERIFKSSGSKPELNKLLSKLEEVKKRKREAAARVEEYDRLHAEIDGLDRELAELEKREDKLRTAAKTAEKLIGAWDDWYELAEAERKLAALPVTESFPPDGMQRFEKLVEKRSDTDSNMKEAEELIKNALKRKETVHVDEKILELKSEIENLQKGSALYESERRALESAREQIREDDSMIESMLRDMGPNWTEERLQELDISIPRDESVRIGAEELKSAGDSITGAEIRVQGAEKAFKRAEQKVNGARLRLKEVPEPEIKDRRLLLEKKRELKDVLAACRSVSELEAGMEVLDRDIRRVQDELKRAAHIDAGSSRTAAGWPGYAVAALAALAGMAAINAGYAAPGMLLIIAATAGFAACVLLAKRSKSSEDGGFGRVLKEIEDRLETDIADRKDAESMLVRSKKELGERCKAAGIEKAPEAAGVEAGIDDLEEMLGRLERWTARKEALDGALQGRDAASDDLDSVRKQLDELRSVRERKRLAWEEWLSEAGLPAGLTPQGALDMFRLAGKCRDVQRRRSKTRQRLKDAEKYVSEYDGAVRTAAGRWGCEVEHTGGALRLLDVMADALADAEKARTRRSELVNLIERLNAETVRFRARGREIADSLSELLAEAGAEDENDFRRIAGLAHERRRLFEAAGVHKKALEKSAGSGPEADTFMKMLESASKSSREIELKKAEEELERVKLRRTELDRELGARRKELDDIKERGTVGGVRLEEENLLAQMRQLARAWSCRAVASKLLEMARERYERERQPAVIKNAAGFFSTITGGRFKGIISPPGDEMLAVVDNMERRIGPDRLSRGTAEQLFFALRLGLIQEFSTHREPLPVVMDEVTVNFDPKRTRAALRAVLELSETHQVLFFTCHPGICDMMAKLEPSVPVYRLAGGCIFSSRT